MENLIREIRKRLNTNQEQFASMLGISSLSINRWETGKVTPSIAMQKQLYELCIKHNLDLTDYLAEQERKNGEHIFYHASRSGITNRIEPKSRSKCDFGKGFYMGTNPLQPLTLVCNEKNPIFYTVEFDTSELKVLNIDMGIEWAMFIACNRGYIPKNTKLYDKYAYMADGYDVITGYIANDRMYQVLTDFFERRIMDTALIASLSALKLGKQYVAISQKACDNIKILNIKKLEKLELMLLSDKSEVRRKEGRALAEQMVTLHRRDGKFFDEILEEGLL